MKRFIFSLFILFSLMLNSCIYEDEFGEAEVLYVEDTLISYNDFYCREALTKINSKQYHLLFPIQYEDVIKSGTNIKYNCNKIYYYKNKHKDWIKVDWLENNKN